MVAQNNASTSGVDTQGEVRKRNVVNGVPNGIVPSQLADKVDEKTKQKVRVQ